MGFLSKQASTSLNSKSSSGGGYLKIIDKSEVRFTILEQHPLEFYEVWATNPDNKDERRTLRWDYQPTAEDVAADLGDWVADEKYDQPGTQNVKFTLACPVFNYATNTVQVYSFNQTTVMREIDAISQMEDFDKDITTVDLVVAYDKSNPPALMYTVRPVPKKKGTEAMVAAAWIEAKENGFDISRLITGGNPFKPA
jgi:hypothetical protein